MKKGAVHTRSVMASSSRQPPTGMEPNNSMMITRSTYGHDSSPTSKSRSQTQTSQNPGRSQHYSRHAPVSDEVFSDSDSLTPA